MSAPIHRNGFSFCSGSFHIEVESGNPNTRHERESASRLYYLLTYVAPTEPILTNTGKVAKQQPPPHKDLSGHFYRAQLLHYGLPELKTKEPAKKRLLAAFTNGPKGEKVLKVPSNILKLEKEMRVEWTKLNDAEMKKRQEEKEAKKIREAELARDTARFYQQDLFMDVDEDDNESAPIPAYVVEARVALFSLERAIAEKLLDKVLNQHQDAEYTLRNELEKLGVIKSGRACNFTDYPDGFTGNKIPGILAQQQPEPPKPQPRQTARKTTGGRKPPGPKRSTNAIAGPSRPCKAGIDLAGNSEDKAPRALQTARKGPAIKSKRIRDPSGYEGQPAPKKRKNDTMSIHNFINSRFIVSVPEVASNWPRTIPHDGQTIKFSPSSTNSHLWGKFDFGVIYGIIRSVGSPPTRAGQKINFVWRGRECGEDRMTFGDRNKGTITFSADGKIKCTFEGSVVGNTNFSGHLDPRPTGATGISDEVCNWKREWRLINYQAYEAEGAARWGKWVDRDGNIESPAYSDTTDGAEGSDDFEYNY